jgi:hypothetical protein
MMPERLVIVEGGAKYRAAPAQEHLQLGGRVKIFAAKPERVEAIDLSELLDIRARVQQVMARSVSRVP